MVLEQNPNPLWKGSLLCIQWTPSNPATLGTSQSVLIREVASFRGEFALGSILWGILKWPEYRGGLISGVQIRGSSLYYSPSCQFCFSV